MQRRRPAAAPAATAAPASAPVHASGPAAPAAASPLFEYRGHSSLQLFNPATGHRYVFAAQGARLRADPVDSAWLEAVPWLSRVS